MNEMPKRTFDVGIAEGHAVTFSAGLAKEGMVPFCNIYSTFMQRAYDNVIHDVALQNLSVIFCLDRAGLVGNDGATHQGQFDIAMFRPIPNMTIAVPRSSGFPTKFWKATTTFCGSPRIFPAPCCGTSCTGGNSLTAYSLRKATKSTMNISPIRAFCGPGRWFGLTA